MTRLALLSLVLAAACGPAPARPTGPGEAPVGPPTEAARVLQLGDDFLTAQRSWRAARELMNGTDYDVEWEHLDAHQQSIYVEALDQVVAMADELAADAMAHGDPAAAPLRARVAATTRYREGEMSDPPDEIGAEVSRLVDDSQAALLRLARAIEPPAERACFLGRLELALAISAHLDELDEARLQSEMGVYETGLPPGSAEQEEVEAEAAQLGQALDAWELVLRSGTFVDVTELALEPLPELDPPPGPVPEPLADGWAAVERAVATARTACAALPRP